MSRGYRPKHTWNRAQQALACADRNWGRLARGRYCRLTAGEVKDSLQPRLPQELKSLCFGRLLTILDRLLPDRVKKVRTGLRREYIIASPDSDFVTEFRKRHRRHVASNAASCDRDFSGDQRRSHR
jgi:hypothetical protein